MTPEHDAPDRPAPPDDRMANDILIFFPPGAARQSDAHCTLYAAGSAAGAPACRIVLQQGAQQIAIDCGGTHAFPTAARAADRPVVVRIAAREDAISVQVGPRPPTALPGLAPAFAFDGVESSPHVAIDCLTPEPADSPLLPRGLNADAGAAGAVDHVSIAGGITGWVVDLARPGAPHDVELHCGDAVLARTRADRPRPAAAPHAAQAPLGRFSFPWAEIDRALLERCAAATPAAPLTLRVPELGARLDNVYRPLSARTALALAGPLLDLTGRAGAPLARLTQPRISAVIPNYNYAQYLPQRIGSLLAQDAALELILLDDASTDDSLGVALATARDAGREIQIVTSPRNSGAVLPQWRRAAALARGDYVLIAEADDAAEPTLVSTLAALLDAHPDMAFAFADSAQIDADGAVTRPDFKGYYAALGDRALEREQVFAAGAFLLRFLAPRNLVVNVSAVLWRTAALRAAFERLGPTIDDFRAAGDWRVYIEACLAGGTIGYVPTPLNRFRRHDASVVGRYTRDRHIAEVEAIHALILSLCDGDPTIAERLAHHRAALHRLWSLEPDAHEAGGTP